MNIQVLLTSTTSNARRFRTGILLGVLLQTALTVLSAAPSRAAWDAALWINTPLAKFEPERGCYIGAFIERDYTVQGNISEFEALTRKKHASYITYVGYGRPFPMQWVKRVKAAGSSAHIAFEPNGGLENVRDDEYLRAWARDAARSQVPIFLRWASEMNGSWAMARYGSDAEIYKEKFRLVARVMREEAPNVAMVWTPFAEPQKYIELFYPGDEAVDWVGVNIYSVYVNDGDPFRPAFQRDPIEFLRYIYETYSPRKPIHVSEYAATVFCKGTAQQTVDFAIEKMTRFYTALRQEFPRVKAVQWFCLDTIKAGLANNNYSFLDNGRVLYKYRELVADEYFLSQVAYDPNNFTAPARTGTTVGADAVAMEGQNAQEAIDMMENAGAIAATITEPMLRGLKPNQIVTTDMELRAQLPLGMTVQFMVWQVDGKPVALINTEPYRVSVPRERFGPGKHTARLVVFDKNGVQHQSPEVPFEIAE